MELLQRLKEPSSWAAAAAAGSALYTATNDIYHAIFAGVAALLGFVLPEKSK